MIYVYNLTAGSSRYGWFEPILSETRGRTVALNHVADTLAPGTYTFAVVATDVVGDSVGAAPSVSIEKITVPAPVEPLRETVRKVAL